MLEEELKQIIRDVPDFPKKGIIFKDITPILSRPDLCEKIIDQLAAQARDMGAEAVAGIEARGFLFGPSIAQKLNVPFIPIRKKGKLPYKSFEESYQLEYGSATIEMHTDAFEKGKKILIHDDLLATGGTAVAAAKLIEKLGTVAGFSFLIDLSFLCGAQKLHSEGYQITSILKY